MSDIREEMARILNGDPGGKIIYLITVIPSSGTSYQESELSKARVDHYLGRTGLNNTYHYFRNLDGVRLDDLDVMGGIGDRVIVAELHRYPDDDDDPGFTL